MNASLPMMVNNLSFIGLSVIYRRLLAPMAKVRILISCSQKVFSVEDIDILYEIWSTSLSAAMNLEKLKLFRHYYVMVRRSSAQMYFSSVLHPPKRPDHY